MKANETKVEDFLAHNKTQFVIPVYQRNYDWHISQCEQLFNDIIDVGDNKDMTAHFIGSIVFIHDDVYFSSRIKELTIIDGQQRLTTLTLIYLVINNLAKQMNNDSLVNEITETYLINKFAAEEEKLKLRPTENNDAALKYLLRGDLNEEFTEYSKLIVNYEFFKEKINIDNYEVVLKGLSKLMFVEISLDREKDDPQRIFESLNSTGLELSQADLIRNYILMGLNRKSQKHIYENYWEYIEQYAKDESVNISKVSDFIRDYLTLESRNIPNKGKVYHEFKIKYPISTIEKLESTLGNLKSLVTYYNKLINPQNEIDKDIRRQLEYISRLEVNVAYPFLMKVYEDFSSQGISKEVFILILELIQSYTWRRFIVGLPTSALNKIFMSLYEKIDKANYLLSLQRSLLTRTGVQRFPNNAETLDALRVKDVYNIKPKNRMYLFDRLENFQNSEQVMIEGNDAITIEHIFPQNPDAKWKIVLGQDEYNYIKENYLNTLANLTLSGNNGKLGNKPFTDKRDLRDFGYRDSRLWLNKYLGSIEQWNKASIKDRFKILSQRFLEIWPIPKIEVQLVDSSEVNIFDAEDPRHKKLEYAIFFDQKIEVKEVAKLYLEIFKQLFELQPDTFFTTDIGAKIGLTRNPDDDKSRQALPLNEIYFIEGNIDNRGKFDRIKLALKRFGFEDELIIKYADTQSGLQSILDF